MTFCLWKTLVMAQLNHTFLYTCLMKRDIAAPPIGRRRPILNFCDSGLALWFDLIDSMWWNRHRVYFRTLTLRGLATSMFILLESLDHCDRLQDDNPERPTLSSCPRHPISCLQFQDNINDCCKPLFHGVASYMAIDSFSNTELKKYNVWNFSKHLFPVSQMCSLI